jgi:hypothetical protein
VLDGGDALVLEDGSDRGDPRRLVLCGGDGRRRILLEDPDLACAIGSGEAVLVGSTTGEIRRVEVENAGSTGERVRLEGPIVAFSTAGSGSHYVLYGRSGSLLGRLDPDLSIGWSAPCASRCERLASTPDGEHVWILDLEAERLRKFDRAGNLALERAVPGSGGSDRSAATEAGGIVLATPGALLVLDGQGNARPGQGGFVFVSDVDRIPGR